MLKRDRPFLEKKMASRTYIAKLEKQARGFKASKERLTLLLCSNVKPRALIGRFKMVACSLDDKP